ncbi:hypothetical protein R1flu_004661 [Riccia fluitans]|uniref:CCHC-type domain-containing protein n=1 Tax=Riccia fluitans TaxID=41844 RepID=A0ABD1YQY7_9MARC
MATNNQLTHSRPTGCYKCGLPGHWSFDCPVKSTNGPAAGGRSSTVQAGSARGAENVASGGGDRTVGKGSLKGRGTKAAAAEAAIVKVPRKRPQLTAELLLSDSGLGYLLEKMPQMVKIRGEGHEVHDLKSLLEGYVHWHSQLHPYLGFTDFVAKIEKLGATRRVRMCVKELRDKVTGGLGHNVNQEPDREDVTDGAAQPSTDGAGGDGRESEEWVGADFNDLDETDANQESAMPVNEDEFEDFFRQGTTQPNESLDSGGSRPTQRSALVTSSPKKLPSLLDEDAPSVAPAPVAINETIAARMEANRLKALERAKALGVRQSDSLSTSSEVGDPLHCEIAKSSKGAWITAGSEEAEVEIMEEFKYYFH